MTKRAINRIRSYNKRWGREITGLKGLVGRYERLMRKIIRINEIMIEDETNVEGSDDGKDKTGVVGEGT